MLPEVVAAMQEAALSYVVLEELQERASQLIARATGAEAGTVTGGAAAGLLLGTAACITEGDPGKIERLPDTSGMKSTALMHRAHRNGYDHSVRAAGAQIVEFGYPHVTHHYQLETAIDDNTALVVYLKSPWATKGALSLAETCDIAHRRGVPVLVDAAATLPPASNLRRFIEEGADLVVFSGGKGLRGPQSSGILAGRADLIRAAMLNGSPNHSIGRPAKAAKEDIVGLMVALDVYLRRDHEADLARWMAQAEYIASELGDFPGVNVSIRYDAEEYITPCVELAIDREETDVDAHQFVQELEAGDPRLFLIEWNGPSASRNNATVCTHTMQEGDEEAIAAAIKRELTQRLAFPAVA
jgi:L-seryl-tRNA(Ser) seleniumtransferase